MAVINLIQDLKTWSLTVSGFQIAASEMPGGGVSVSIRSSVPDGVRTRFEARDLAQAEKFAEFFIDEQLLADAARDIKIAAERGR